MVRQLRMADHDGCTTVTMRLVSGNRDSRPACRSRCGASWSEGDEDEEQGKGRDSSLLRVAPHSHTFSLSRSHHHLNQSVNDSEKFISLAPTLPPYPSLPFGAASPNRKNYLLCNRLSLHLRHLPKHPCPRRLVRRHHFTITALSAPTTCAYYLRFHRNTYCECPSSRHVRRLL